MEDKKPGTGFTPRVGQRRISYNPPLTKSLTPKGSGGGMGGTFGKTGIGSRLT